jgi:Protein of unknown function (DUF2786)
MTPQEKQEKYADKIAKLLAKAESTTPEEAELLLAKAQELMTQYAITEALIDQARGVERDEIEQRTFAYGGYYHADKGNLAWIIIRNNGCRGVYMRSGEWTSARTIGDKTYRMWYEITATGFRSDLDRVSLLESSLQIQMARALNDWWKTEDRSWMSKTQNVRARQSFMEHFAYGVDEKLRTATIAGRKAAERDAAGGTSEDAAKDAVALVLRSRKDRVDEWMDRKYGTLRAGRGSYRKTDYNAAEAGRSAGRRADVGQPGMKNRKGLNR